jgi:virulence-associated protein VagC
VASQSILPAYRGSVWIDKETSRVLRIEMQAVQLPKEFPFDKIESSTDYQFIRIGDRQFLLPVHAEVLNCQRGSDDCSRNAIDFRNYHKYSGDSSITFDK